MTTYATANPPRSQPRGGLATLVVLVIMVGILVGGLVAQNAVADEPPKPVEVGRGVVVTPGWEWEFAGRSDDGTTILLTQGSGSLAITVKEGADARTALEALRSEWEASGTVTTTDIEEVAGVRADRPVLRFSYSGTFDDIATPVEGEVTGVAGNGAVATFDGWAGLGEYPAVSGEIAQMISSAVIP